MLNIIKKSNAFLCSKQWTEKIKFEKILNGGQSNSSKIARLDSFKINIFKFDYKKVWLSNEFDYSQSPKLKKKSKWRSI